ncbi:MAG: hypothetical protein QM582_16185 [Micropruina sp.]|uniref:hypothetical protein n=1 Tax=Micropruina sp. TaxID=2737536 RepID=UPI0039E71E3D
MSRLDGRDCGGCGRPLIAAPDDQALIAMEEWWEDEQDRTWCLGCEPAPATGPDAERAAPDADSSVPTQPQPMGAAR